ncbi:unnamed protein product, partial [marine sediment metagenome]
MPVVFDWKEEDFQTLIGNCPDEPVTPYILKYVPKEGRVLEAGCGSGRFVYYLNGLGYDITGIEINPQTVEVLNRRYPELDIVQGDVRRLPFPDESFSGLLSLGVIEHVVEGLDEPIREMFRVLTRKGYALVIVPSFNTVRKIKHAIGVYHAGEFAKSLTLVRKLFGKPPRNPQCSTEESR